MCGKREMKQFLRSLEDIGFTVEPTKNGHVKITNDNMDGPVFTSSTPSDHRSIKNITSVIRRKMKIPVDI